MEKFLEFYGLDTTTRSKPDFSMWAVVFGLLRAVILATMSIIPLFHAKLWIIGVGSVIAMTVLLITLNRGIWHLAFSSLSFKRDREKYISPSLSTQIALAALLLPVVTSFAIFRILTSVTGWDCFT